jgi:5'-nucleotidase
VKLAINKLLPNSPELVVSGINHGANVGIAVIYSGTVAAAIEAAFLGIPAIAVSLHLEGERPGDFARAAKLALSQIRQILEIGLKPGQMVNINIPSLDADEKPKGVRVVRQCVHPWTDTYEERVSPGKQRYFWNDTVYKLVETEDDTDVAGIRDKYITVTPLQFDLTEYSLLKRLQEKVGSAFGTITE